MNRAFLNIIIVVAASVILCACGDNKQAAPNPANMPVPVNVYEAHAEKALYHEKFPGTVTALMQVDVRAEVEGYVTGIFFKEGDHVTKGQKLYTIDDAKYRANFNAAQASVKVAQSNLEQAQKDADRYTYLSQHDAVAKQTLDHAMTTLQNAKDQVTAAKQDLARAQTDLGYSIIKAPFDGTIGISQVKVGNTVATGQTILNTISSDNPMAVDFLVNEKQIPRFMKLKQQPPPASDSVFTLLMADNTLYPGVGQISSLDRGVNPQTGTITVRLVFPNSGAMLKAGMSCTVLVRNNDTSARMMVPSKAVVEQMGEYFMYIARDTVIAGPDTSKSGQSQAPSPHAVQRKVTLGQTIADRVIVNSGIQEGDNVIVDGVQKLHPGSVINVGGQKPAAHQ